MVEVVGEQPRNETRVDSAVVLLSSPSFINVNHNPVISFNQHPSVVKLNRPTMAGTITRRGIIWSNSPLARLARSHCAAARRPLSAGSFLSCG